MRKGKNTAEVLGNDDDLGYVEPAEGEHQDRTLVLKAEPPSRKAHLIAHGVKEIRCVSCGQIRPIAGAEEYDEGWVCEHCLPAARREPRYSLQRARQGGLRYVIAK